MPKYFTFILCYDKIAQCVVHCVFICIFLYKGILSLLMCALYKDFLLIVQVMFVNDAHFLILYEIRVLLFAVAPDFNGTFIFF